MPSDLSDLLHPDLITIGMVANNKKTLFQHLGSLAAPILELEPGVIAGALSEREKLGSTGFGGGVALPHARIEGLPRIVIMIARLAHAVEFNAVDNMPVDMVVAILSPPAAGADHLKALARVSNRLRDRAFVAKLRGAGSRDAIYALLTTDDPESARNAA